MSWSIHLLVETEIGAKNDKKKKKQEEEQLLLLLLTKGRTGTLPLEELCCSSSTTRIGKVSSSSSSLKGTAKVGGVFLEALQSGRCCWWWMLELFVDGQVLAWLFPFLAVG